MPYGTIKVDNITFTDNSVDKTVSLSGLIQNPTFTGNVTATGTISGDVIRGGTTISGVTVTGTTANFVSGVFTTRISGATITGTTVAATTGNYTSLTGVTTTGTTANFVSGVFTTQISGATITGTTVATTTGSFVSLTGTTATFTSGIIASGTDALPSLAILSDPNTGIYSPGADQLAISTNGTGRLFVDASGNVGVGLSNPSYPLEVAAPTDSTINITGGTSNLCRLFFSDTALARGFLNYDHADDSLRIGTAASERLRITSAGLVGIGTSAPSNWTNASPALAVVNSNTTAYSATSFAASPNLILTGGSASGAYNAIRFTGTGTNEVSFGVVQEAGGAGAFVFQGYSGTAYSERLRIDSSGRVGIGTTDMPSDTNLTVLGNFQSGFYRNVTSGNRAYYLNLGAKTSGGFADGGRIAGVVESGDSAGYLTFSTRTGGVITEKAQIDSSGRLLVGTSTQTGPSYLQIEGNTSEGATGGGSIRIRRGAATPVNGANLGTIVFSDNTTGDGAYIQGQRDAGTWSASSLPTRLVFSTTPDGTASPTERMQIGNKGKVIFTCVDSSNVDAIAVYANGTSGSQYGITVSTANDQNNTGTHFFRGMGGATERFTARTNGGLANIQANNVNLSDRNTKKDISPATDTWNCLKDWEIVNYRYKDQPDDADLNLGVIAQQVAESCPEVITIFQEAKEATDDAPAREERLGVKEQQMYWMAIKALQEAQVRIETLEASNADMLARLSALEGA